MPQLAKSHGNVPADYGLYDPTTEHDACGIGFVAHIKGEKSRDIVQQGLEILRRLSHRAASGSDAQTGDGAGISLQLPHRWFKAKGLALGFDMPRRRRYAVGQLFMPRDPTSHKACEKIVEEVISAEGQRVLGWRDVPTSPAHAGESARHSMPVVRQIFIARRRVPPSAFERKLFVIRKLIEKEVVARGVDPAQQFHVVSISAETIIYKGLLLPSQLPEFYPDLQESEMVSAIAVVHSRFSTNTLPSWHLAQPFRYICHNGEINTLRGNRNWMNARRSQLQSAKFGGSLDRLFPFIVPGGSDSAQFDNMLELLHLGGRSLPHAMMMMIPEAWENHHDMPPERRYFYEYASSLVEPWDGPAAIVFTDGSLVGATLDRNGLRPARYLITTDDRIVLASETGVFDVAPQNVRHKGRLQPGKMLVVDTSEGRIIDDSECKADIARRWPYKKWLATNSYHVDGVERSNYNVPPFPDVAASPRLTRAHLRQLQSAFGYTDEDEKLIIRVMAEQGKEPTGSMGSDTPLAVLSHRAPNLFQYFHQLFAQVTNPAIDPIRERLVMSLATAIGPDGNTFEETPEQCHRLLMDGPILTNEKLAKISAIHEGVFEPIKLSVLFPVAQGPSGLAAAVARLCETAREAIDEGYNVLILSDRGVDVDHAAIPALLAVSSVHHHLIREGTRMQTGLIIETGEAREVHDFALLLGYGVAAINPYLALDTIKELCAEQVLSGEVAAAKQRYIAAVADGLLKVMSKMGISTLQSYRGGQIFECIGLDRDLVDTHFTGTSSRLGGIGMLELGQEALERHHRGFGDHDRSLHWLPVGGAYQWRPEGEFHQWNPDTISALQAATRQNDLILFEKYAALVDDEDRALCTLRGLLDFDFSGVLPVALSDVEPAAEIVKRFVSGAMSFGSISAEAHETLAIAMNRLGARSNSGEGGEEAHRFTRDKNGDDRGSKIKQIASARFGVTPHYLRNAEELQIKVAQGAKPGEGGQLPGDKVDERIARVRHATPGVTLISPPPHHDIYSIEDLAQLIHDLQVINPAARISVKLVSEVGVGTVAAGVAKAHAGCIIIAGGAGGTGASPLSSLKHAGLPWELGLAEAQQVLVQNDLRGRVRLQVDGGLRTGRDIVTATLLGAEEYGMATAALVTQGCVMLRKCHLNTCSVGIATQDHELRKRFAGRSEDIVNFFMLVAEQVRKLMAQLGFRTIDEMVGKVERLRVKPHANHWKAQTLDLRHLLAPPWAPAERLLRFEKAVPYDVDHHADHRFLAEAELAWQHGQKVKLASPVDNTQRAIATMLSGHLIAACGPDGLPSDFIELQLSGSAGQSLGAFLAPGISIHLVGDANDYVGKGMAGGKITVRPPQEVSFVWADNVIIGNTVLYGATGGELFAAGIAGERFAVRNSGAQAVVEGVGDHGCEYMTGGTVLVLGKTGRNFAAGMSGGIAYIFDDDQCFSDRCNHHMVELQKLTRESDIEQVYRLISDHVKYTQSPLGQSMLADWRRHVSRFVKVVPVEYQKALQRKQLTTLPNAAASKEACHG